MNLLRIVPVEHEHGQPCRTMGTKVLTADGSEVGGVQKIVLTAEIEPDVWRAEIHCLVDPPKLAGVLANILYHREGFIRRWIRRLRGISADLTTLASTFARRFGL